MVSRPGGPADTRRIRRLKTPQAIEVEAGEDGSPQRLCQGNAWHDLALTRRPWRIDQHWWRSEPISRLYYQVLREDGPPLTLFHDLISGAWLKQEY